MYLPISYIDNGNIYGIHDLSRYTVCSTLLNVTVLLGFHG